MTFPIVQQPALSVSTIVPENENLFVPYLNNLYQGIASTVNNKDNIYFTTAITDTAANIPNLPNFGAFIICVSGTAPEKDNTGVIIGWLPTITASLCKADSTAAGSIATLGSQVGTGSWAGNALTISATAANFQIKHNRAAVTGNFNIRIIGTQ